MKTLLFFTIFILYGSHLSKAQSDSICKRQGYQTWVTTYDDTRVKTGVLQQINDSSISIMSLAYEQRFSPGKIKLSTIDVRSIDLVKVRKKGNAGRGVLFGALAGLVVGGALDLIYCSNYKLKPLSKDHTLDEKIAHTASYGVKLGVNATLIGVACLGTGIAIGAIVGSAKITIPINGSREQFDQNRATLNNYSTLYNARLTSKPFVKLRETIADIDGNSYNIVALGGQVWMAEDLKTTRFRDGTTVTGMAGSLEGTRSRYNWVSVSDKRGLCPSGWHVPGYPDWVSLFNCLGGEGGTGKKLEEGFSAGTTGQWWSSTEQDTSWARSFYLNTETVGVLFSTNAKTTELAVRCIRDN